MFFNEKYEAKLTGKLCMRNSKKKAGSRGMFAGQQWSHLPLLQSCSFCRQVGGFSASLNVVLE